MEVGRVGVDIVKKDAKVLRGFGVHIIPLPQRNQRSVAPMSVANGKVGSVGTLFLLTPVDLHCSEFRSRNFHAKDYTKGRNYVRLAL